MLRACLPAQLIREKYWEYGYEEVVTPNLFNFELWERSGHAEHYKDNMFLVDIEKQDFGLKPMNCPGNASASLQDGCTMLITYGDSSVCWHMKKKLL